MELPHNNELEEAILASVLIDARKLDELQERGINEEYFLNTKHQVIMEALPKILSERGIIDAITLIEWLMEHEISGTVAAQYVPKHDHSKRLITFVPHDFVAGLTSEIYSTANFSAWARMLAELYEARMYATHCDAQYQAVCKQPSQVRDLVEQSASWIINRNYSDAETLQGLSTLAPAAYEQMEAVRNGEVPIGLQFGLRDLDSFFCLRPGTMNVLAARPAMGKSALGLLAAYHNARRPVPKATLIFSLEMGSIDMTQRLIAMHGPVNVRAYENDRSHITPATMRGIANEVSRLPIWLEEAAPINIFRIRSIARRMIMRHNIALIIIDYLQLADVENNRLSREQGIGEISRNCKLMARELNVPVLALAQLNREVEKRDPPRPRLSDLRDSGTLEQDADTVLFLSPTTKDPAGNYVAGEKMVIEVAKHRAGAIAAVPCYFRKQFVKFENYTNEV